MTIRILFIGDIVGEPGIAVVQELLPELLSEQPFDLVIANGENACNGRGITVKQVKELLKTGIHVITGGNHTFDREKVNDAFTTYGEVLLRPANYTPEVIGNGSTIFTLDSGVKIAILNLQGRLFMPSVDNPFVVGERIISELSAITPLIFVDFHAEATAEKIALARYFDGKISALIGTHTHVQTNDEEILPGGTGFLCDAGMTGAHGGVIGMETTTAISRLKLSVAPPSAPATTELRLHGVAIEIDSETGKTTAIHTIRRKG